MDEIKRYSFVEIASATLSELVEMEAVLKKQPDETSQFVLQVVRESIGVILM